MSKKRRLGYLSAAPRVSTRLDAEASGPRAHVLGVIKAFAELEWEVQMYIVGDRLPSSLLHGSEKRLESSVFTRFVADIVRLIMGIYHSLKAYFELRDVDWVYERCATLQVLGWIFQSRGIPWILETSGLFFYEAKVERKSIVLSKVAEKLEIWAYQNCDVLVCVSSALKELIVEYANVEPEKIIVVPNGVDAAFFDPVQHTAKRIFEGPVLGFVGALVNWHRLDILFEAVAALRDRGFLYYLVILGDGPMRDTWETSVEMLNLKSQVFFIGRVSWEQVPVYMNGFDLGFMGNAQMKIGKMYHSPLKLYEYMAMSLPVVASSYDDSNTVIDHLDNGFLFLPGNQKNLETVLVQAYQHRGSWNLMGENARKKILEDASWLKRVGNMVAEIDNVLKREV